MANESQDWHSYGDLNSFLDVLKKSNDLIEIRKEVSPRFEIGAILDELSEKGGPAALFTNIAGFAGKTTVGNVMGHRRRLAKVLGVEETKLIDAFMERKNQRILSVQVTEAPVKEVKIEANEVDLLHILPALIHHEKDSSPYLTCAVTFARDPETGYQSMCLHRVQIRSDKRLCVYLATPPLAQFFKKAQKMNKPLDIAVVIGPDPAVLMASITRCPEGVDKIEIAGGLRQKPVEMVQCETVNLSVPSNSQYVIEGTIQVGQVAAEGVFGESSGVYVEGDQSPVISVTHVSHRESPLYQALLPWSGEDDALFDLCFGSDLLENARRDFPFVRDLHMIPGTVNGHVIVSISEKCSPPMLRSAMIALLTRNRFIKKIIAVDEDIDVRNYKEVEWAVLTRFQADKDLILLPGVHGSMIDPSASPNGSTCKIGIDATFPEEQAILFQKIKIPEESRKRAIEILDSIKSDI